MSDGLDRLERLLDEATPGPWWADRIGGIESAKANITKAHAFSRPASSDAGRNRALIVALRNAAPELIAVARMLRESGPFIFSAPLAEKGKVALAALDRALGETP
jgi:hypothetical protein